MATYRVIGLDVWGHGPDEHSQYECSGDCEGYNVNDAHYCGDVEVGTDSDADIIGALVKWGYLTPDCTPTAIEVDGEPEFLFINRKDDKRPLLQLELVQS